MLEAMCGCCALSCTDHMAFHEAFIWFYVPILNMIYGQWTFNLKFNGQIDIQDRLFFGLMATADFLLKHITATKCMTSVFFIFCFEHEFGLLLFFFFGACFSSDLFFFNQRIQFLDVSDLHIFSLPNRTGVHFFAFEQVLTEYKSLKMEFCSETQKKIKACPMCHLVVLSWHLQNI